MQFDSPAQQAALDRRLPPAARARMQASRYGLSVSGAWELATFAAVPVATVLPMAWLLHPVWWPPALLLALGPLLMTRFVHPLLHAHPAVLRARHGRLLRWIVGTRAFRWLRGHHLIHHRRAGERFNLLPGGDWLLGTWRPRRRAR